MKRGDRFTNNLLVYFAFPRWKSTPYRNNLMSLLSQEPRPIGPYIYKKFIFSTIYFLNQCKQVKLLNVKSPGRIVLILNYQNRPYVYFFENVPILFVHVP